MNKLKNILNNHVGYYNRITRQELCLQLNISDSILRIKISELRQAGMKIVSHHNIKGYYKLDPINASLEDWKHYKLMIADMKCKLATQQKVLSGQEVIENQMNLLEVNNGTKS